MRNNSKSPPPRSGSYGKRRRPPAVSAPDGDDFYVSPSSLPGTHGDVIWSRPLAGPAALESAARTELVLYRSDAADGAPIAVSGIIALPRSPAPATGYPVVSWAHGTLGLGGKWAPSRDSAAIAAELPEHHAINQAPHVLLNALLERGFAIVMTDYEGLGAPGPHPYLLGVSEARSVLDIVRAARRMHPEISSRVLIAGHSQGGQAALFAAYYGPTWTPELDLRGVAALAPASHVKDSLLGGSRYPQPHPGFAFTPLMLTGAIVGAKSSGSKIDVQQVLSDKALALFQSSGDKCRIELSRPDSWGGLLGTEQFRGDLTGQPNEDQKEFLRQLDLTNPALAIKSPIRLAHAQPDTRIGITNTNKLVEELGALGNDVTYRIYPVVGNPSSLGAHFGIIDTETPTLTDWFWQLGQ